MLFISELVLTISSLIYIFDMWAACTGLHVWWAAASTEHPYAPGPMSASWDSHLPPSGAVGCLKKGTRLPMGWLGYGVYCQGAGWSAGCKVMLQGKKSSLVLISTGAADFLVWWRIAWVFAVMADPFSFPPSWRASDCELLSSFFLLLTPVLQGMVGHAAPYCPGRWLQ